MTGFGSFEVTAEAWCYLEVQGVLDASRRRQPNLGVTTAFLDDDFFVSENKPRVTEPSFH